MLSQSSRGKRRSSPLLSFLTLLATRYYHDSHSKTSTIFLGQEITPSCYSCSSRFKASTSRCYSPRLLTRSLCVSPRHSSTARLQLTFYLVHYSIAFRSFHASSRYLGQ